MQLVDLGLLPGAPTFRITNCFVNALRENLFYQHIVYPTIQRGSDNPHILDLVISTDNFVCDIEYLSPLGMSDHSVLKFNL